MGDSEEEEKKTESAKSESENQDKIIDYAKRTSLSIIDINGNIIDL